MTKLIIAEKPSVAREIAQVVGARSKKQGYIEGSGHIVAWCLGHLVELASPEQLNPAWQGWKLESLPMLPDKMVWQPRGSGQEQLDVLRALCSREDVAQIINACDAGREGELIFRAVMEYLGVGDADPRLHRLWTSSLTETALKQAIGQIKPARQYDQLAAAARSRSVADWLVGMNMTRALTCKAREAGYSGGVLSVGRVQTPTLALVVQRDLEREAFLSKTFFEVLATLLASEDTTPRSSYEARWINAQGESRLQTKAEANQVLERLKLQVTGKIVELKRKAERVSAPRLFDLTSLQREANKRCGLTAQQTLEAAQALYEARLISYPRTDSRAISEDMVQGFEPMLRALEGMTDLSGVPEAAREARGLLFELVKHRHVKPDEVSDHHAILPTGERAVVDGMEPARAQVYELVVRRTLAALLPDGLDEVAQAITELGTDRLITNTRGRVEQGWRTVWESASPAQSKGGKKKKVADDMQDVEAGDATEAALAPVFVQGARVVRERLVMREGKTSPPQAFTEATILTAMEHALKGMVSDEELEQGERPPEGGLGTPATRAATLETLVARLYVERDGKKLISTELGRQVIAALPQGQITSASWTAKWEQALCRIEQGKLDAAQFMAKAKEFTRVAVGQLASGPAPVMRDMTAMSACPVCKTGQVKAFEKGWGCNNRAAQCKFVLWRELCGKALTESQVRDMLAGKKTRTVKGFTSKAGKTFDAALKLNTDGKVEFVFD